MSRNKSLRLQSKEKEDRISDLPDHLIQHILTFLPSTNEAIRTTILSKRWHSQWTRVPVLVFDSTDMSTEKFSRFIDNTLIVYDCSKIKKFQIIADYEYDDDMADCLNNSDVKFRFAITKDVEELFLDFGMDIVLRVPKFIFKHSSYVKLHMSFCDISTMPNQRVNWPNLKELELIRCVLPNQAIENILSGSPSLESFLFEAASEANIQYGIVSKSLKKLMLIDYDCSSSLLISCPNLEKLDIWGCFTDSAPTLRLTNSSSLIRATLGSVYEYYGEINNIIIQFKHVKELIFRSEFIKTLSVLKSDPLLLNNKYLALYLEGPNYNLERYCVGIECALRLSYVLEKLVIWLPMHKSRRTTNRSDLNISAENYWNSNRTVFNCLMSYLKIVEIKGLLEDDDQYKFVLNFIEFLLKNARVLEKLVVRIEDGGKDFVVRVSKKCNDFRRCSQHVTVKLLCSNWVGDIHQRFQKPLCVVTYIQFELLGNVDHMHLVTF